MRGGAKEVMLAMCLAASGARLWARAPSPKVPVQPQIINLSLLEALVATKSTNLAGVFGFVPEDKLAMAMADYLMHNQNALKLFIKKGEKDFKEVQGINDWDKQVYLYLVGINASVNLPADMNRIPAKWMSRVDALGLAQPLPLQIMVQRRSARMSIPRP